MGACCAGIARGQDPFAIEPVEGRRPTRAFSRVPLRTVLWTLLRPTGYALRLSDDVPDLAVTIALREGEPREAADEVLGLVADAFPEIRWRWEDDALLIYREPPRVDAPPGGSVLRNTPLREALRWLEEVTGRSYRVDDRIPNVPITFDPSKSPTRSQLERRFFEIVARRIPGLTAQQRSQQVLVTIHAPEAIEPPPGWQRLIGAQFAVYYPLGWEYQRNELPRGVVMHFIRPQRQGPPMRNRPDPRLCIVQSFEPRPFQSVRSENRVEEGMGVLRVGGLTAIELWGVHAQNGRRWREVHVASGLVGYPYHYSLYYAGVDDEYQAVMDQIIHSFHLRPRLVGWDSMDGRLGMMPQMESPPPPPMMPMPSGPPP